ncbi:hypothetical protein ACTNBL_10000 [Enterococcus villorum]|uniref:Uncharacterized protein n=1 Tax=Enterococcus villorum TaxID=112904 RepID=A0A511J4X7_9ENTE|nr:hypothetical protein [Enterococcus villorum]GEL93034.1 hypothetical protein EVI01_23710 [Enterococcus villorum]
METKEEPLDEEVSETQIETPNKVNGETQTKNIDKLNIEVPTKTPVKVNGKNQQMLL